MATPCDVAWGHLNPGRAIASITQDATAEQWKAAYRDRRALILFLKGPQNVSKLPGPGPSQSFLLKVMAGSLEQNLEQRARFGNWLDDLPRNPEFASTFELSFTGNARADRPFCTIMHDKDINKELHDFVQKVSKQMTTRSSDVRAASKALYLCALGWDRLNPLQQARGVLAAIEYVKWIKRMWSGASHLARPATEPFANVILSIGHRHTPSLTSRQARRSQVSVEELQSRWE